MTAFYNEHDPFAAAWLRELIADNLIAPGVVDERSIEDITPDELRSFQQCHFFAGIGVWSLAARVVGIPDHAPLWTGSCPCQPFSSAGKGGGFDDERHLWPAFHYLLEQCEPPLVAGEQVAGADGDAWFDLVSADLDATGYAFGAAETCAAGFGAPHKRQRNYWVARRLADADAWEPELVKGERAGSGSALGGRARDQLAGRGDARLMADSERARLEGFGGHGDDRDQPGRVGADATGSAPPRRKSRKLADADRYGRDQGRAGLAAPGHDGVIGDGAAFGLADSLDHGQREHGHGVGGAAGAGEVGPWQRQRLRPDPSNGGTTRLERPGPVNGFWRDADWLRCRDEVWRPVRPGSFPLVDAGTFRNRVGLLRGAGNAVTIGQAAGFLRALVDTFGEWW